MRLLLVLLLLSSTALSFDIVSFIQIDFAHMFRVAQCKAKCSEKYGSLKQKEMVDGTMEEYFAVDSEEYAKCESGCLQFQNRRETNLKRSNLTGPTLQGAKFWMEASAHAGKVGSSPISSVQLLCQMPSSTPGQEDLNEGLIGLTKTRPAGPVQYVIQWKHRSHAMEYYDETAWITASVEPSTTIPVDGLIPGLQYKFSVTVVGPAGKLGDTIQSQWAEIGSSSMLKTPGAPLVVKNGFTADHGVMAHLHFPRTAYDSCNFRLQVKNETTAITRDIRVDSTHSILVSNLEFDSSYTVELSALSADRKNMTSSISARFNSQQCKQVYGKGSVNCTPEPVSNLRVVMQPNFTALINWTPSAEKENILTYGITHQAYSGTCDQNPTTVYIDAASTSHELLLPIDRHCEFMIRVTNYDTLGREAFAETHIIVVENKIAAWTLSLRIPIVVLMASIIIFAFAICCIAVCRCCTRRSDKIAENDENKEKLRDYA